VSPAPRPAPVRESGHPESRSRGQAGLRCRRGPGRTNALANPSWAGTSLRDGFDSLIARYRPQPDCAHDHGCRQGEPVEAAGPDGGFRFRPTLSRPLTDRTPFDFNTEQQQIHQHVLDMRAVRQLDHQRSRLQSDERVSPQRAIQRRRNRLQSVACCLAPTNMTSSVSATSPRRKQAEPVARGMAESHGSRDEDSSIDRLSGTRARARAAAPQVFTALVLGFAPESGALAQQTPTPLPLVTPPGPVSHLATRFDVVDAPEQFDRVLLIIDFPGGAWTPSHTSGGYLYVTVIDGEISTRTPGRPDPSTPTRPEARSPRPRASTWSWATPPRSMPA
jgi:hypothetical protein